MQSVQHDAEPFAPRRVAHRADAGAGGYGTTGRRGRRRSRSSTRSRRGRTPLAGPGPRRGAAARHLEHAVAIGSHPHLPLQLLRARRDVASPAPCRRREDRRQVVDRRHRLAAAAQLAPASRCASNDRARGIVEHACPVECRAGTASRAVQQRVRRRLVDRLPTEDQVAERLGAELDVARPVVRAGPLVDEAALADSVNQPGSVKWCRQTQGAMPALAGRAQHLAVVLDRRGVAAPLLGLDARPLDREAVVGEPVLRRTARSPRRSGCRSRCRRRTAAPGRPAPSAQPVRRRRRALGLRRRRAACPTRSRRERPRRILIAAAVAETRRRSRSTGSLRHGAVSRFRYSRWDGTQVGFDLDADALLDEMTDDLLYHGDLNAALRRMLQQGFKDRNGEQLRACARCSRGCASSGASKLDRYDLGGVYDDIAEQLRRGRRQGARGHRAPARRGPRSRATSAARRSSTTSPQQRRRSSTCSRPTSPGRSASSRSTTSWTTRRAQQFEELMDQLSSSCCRATFNQMPRACRT